MANSLMDSNTGPSTVAVSATILIVDDNDDLRAVLCQLLRLRGYRTFDALHGRDALDQFDQGMPAPDVIVLDLDMPVMDGRAFLVERAHRPILHGVPIVVLSAAADAQDQLRGLEVAAVLGKPTQTPHLVALIEGLVGQQPEPKPGVGAVEAEVAAPSVRAAMAPDALAAASEPASDIKAPVPPDPTSIPNPTAT
jgi:CheY-like chemotaxis protein